ncbi:MAG: DUF1573 domain-containing protein, partial [Cyclobacteriaceae bacterium]
KITNGTIVETSFQISNEGTDELRIYNIVPNCSCLRTDSKEFVILPGEFADLKVTLDTSVLTGVQQKTLHVYSNATNGKLHPLIVKVNVVEK